MELLSLHDEFYQKANTSQAFSRFCSDVFGIDLTQEGFSDKTQLNYLINFVHINKNDVVLDIGCGNGKTSAYISSQTNAQVTGIDSSVSAINFACKCSVNNENIKYSIGKIDDSHIPENKFSVILFLDSIHFSANCKETLENAYSKICQGGRIGIFSSDFAFDSYEQPDFYGINETQVAQTIQQNNWRCNCVDLTDQHYELMKRKKEIGNKYRMMFELEQNMYLYNRINKESIPSTVNKQAFRLFSNRYLYCIYK